MQGETEAAVREHGGDGRNSDAGATFVQTHYSARTAQTQAPAHGRLSGDVWTKSARASVHMLKAPRAWCVDVSDLQAAEQSGARLVHVHDMEQLRHYWASTETIRRRGFPLNRRHGEQLALTLDHWRATRWEAEAVSEPEPEPEPLAVQGALW